MSLVRGREDAFVLESNKERQKGVNGGCGERSLQFGPDVISAEVTARTKSLGTGMCCGS